MSLNSKIAYKVSFAAPLIKWDNIYDVKYISDNRSLLKRGGGDCPIRSDNDIYNSSSFFLFNNCDRSFHYFIGK